MILSSGCDSVCIIVSCCGIDGLVEIQREQMFPKDGITESMNSIRLQGGEHIMARILRSHRLDEATGGDAPKRVQGCEPFDTKGIDCAH